MESLLKNIENSINSAIESFVDRIVEKYEEVDKKAVLKLWKSLNENDKKVDKSKLSSKEDKLSSKEDKKPGQGCPYEFTKGTNAGTTCGKKSKDGNEFCSIHRDKADKPKKEKKVLPEPIKTSSKSTLKTSEEKVVLRKHPDLAKFYHPETKMVFHSAENRVVVGKVEDNIVSPLTEEDIERRIKVCDDERLFIIGEALRRGYDWEVIVEWSKIDKFFIWKLKKLVDFEKTIAENKFNKEILLQAKRLGFSDINIAHLWETNHQEIFKFRKENGVMPVYKMVDTCAAEFESETPYFYGTYEEENESVVSDREKIVVLGSGPIRIGQGVEFDYATVHSVWAIKQLGYEAIIINNNPETVSTDFSISDKLYFEPLTEEDVMNIIELEKPKGVIVQFGGQTAINLADKLAAHGVQILGTSLEDLDRAENRDKFERALQELGIPQPLGKTCFSKEEAIEIAKEIGFPVLVRPSYVLGGRAMEIVYNEAEISHYMENAVDASPEHPVLVDRYLTGKEVEVDAICDGETTVIPGIMEHIERAGVHSGDSIAVYPPQNLTEEQIETLVDYTTRLAKGLKVIGLMNIQYVISEGKVYVIEVNPRSSRTVPFLSKITHVPMANLATKAILGKKLKDAGYESGLVPNKEGIYVKVPVFSFSKLTKVDVTLGPEMKSTGEVMGKDSTLEKALYKGMIGAGRKMPLHGSILLTIDDVNKPEAARLAKRFYDIGFKIWATKGTSKYFNERNIPTKIGYKIEEETENLISLIQRGKVQYVVNTTTKGKQSLNDGFLIRRTSVENGVPCLTSMDTVEAILKVIESMTFKMDEM